MSDNPLMNAELATKVLNNFKKISDWCVNGAKSQYPLPPAIQAAANELAQAQAGVEDVKNVISSLQKSIIEHERKIAHLEGSLNGVNAALQSLVEAQKASAAEASSEPQEAPQAAPQAEPQAEPQASQPAEQANTGGLEDLGQVEEPAAKPEPEPEPVAANDKEVELTAKNVDAGNLSPDSYAELDAEINALLSDNG